MEVELEGFWKNRTQIYDEHATKGQQQSTPLTAVELHQLRGEEGGDGTHQTAEGSVEGEQVHITPDVGEVIHAYGHTTVVHEAVDQEGSADDERRRILQEAVGHDGRAHLLSFPLGRRLDDFFGTQDRGEGEGDCQGTDNDGAKR